MKLNLLWPALPLVFTLTAASAPVAFDFKDPKSVNNVVFLLDAPLESINGLATGISGKVDFDPENASVLKGKIVIATDSLHVGNPMMNEHLHGSMWMDVKKFPEIAFESESAANVKKDGDTTTADVTGTLTVKGTARKITVPVKLTYLKGKLSARYPQLQGDLLVLRASFEIKRSDYGINKAMMEDKVSDVIKLTFNLAGMAPK
jgi:polyisoprenoid-binding protein YceI